MKNVIKLLTAGAALLAASALFGQSVTITVATYVADAAGTNTNGMLFGIIVDTNNDGWYTGLTDPLVGIGEMVIPDTSGGPVMMPVLEADGITPTDDYFYIDSAANVTVGAPPPLFPPGFANTIAGVPTNANPLAMGISDNDPFGIIWFPSLGAAGGPLVNLVDTFGFNTDPANVIPPEGFTGTIDNMADGVAGDVPIVPEPSTYAAIFGLVVLGLAYLRRRK